MPHGSGFRSSGLEARREADGKPVFFNFFSRQNIDGEYQSITNVTTPLTSDPAAPIARPTRAPLSSLSQLSNWFFKPSQSIFPIKSASGVCAKALELSRAAI